jgi:repressor LexA
VDTTREIHDPNEDEGSMATFTHRQGQFLAFIHLYRLLHRRGPAETDLVRYFRVTPPSAHLMIVKLEELGLISREPAVPRSARIAIPMDEVPALEPVEGPPW